MAKQFYHGGESKFAWVHKTIKFMFPRTFFSILITTIPYTMIPLSIFPPGLVRSSHHSALLEIMLKILYPPFLGYSTMLDCTSTLLLLLVFHLLSYLCLL